MTDYRVYLFSRTGSIQKAIPLDCDDDSEAVEAAAAERWPHHVEVWQRGRLVSLMAQPVCGR